MATAESPPTARELRWGWARRPPAFMRRSNPPRGPAPEPAIEVDEEGPDGNGGLTHVSHFLRQHHALVLYAFGAFILVRMWFFAFAKKDSKLISFCAFVMLVALYLWWSRRRSQLTARSFPDTLPSVTTDGANNNTQRQEGGVTLEGKQQFVRFNYEGPSSALVMATPIKAAVKQAPSSPTSSVHSLHEEGDDKVEGSAESGATEEKTEAITPSPSPPPMTPAPPASPKKVGDEEPWQYVDQQCSICLCEYEQGDELCMLPCYHAFHDECISVWVQNHSKCPLCLRDLNDTSSPPGARDHINMEEQPEEEVEIEIAQ